MRVLTLVVMLLAAWPAPALSEPSEQSTQVSAEATAAGADFYQAIVFDSGALDLTIRGAFQLVAPSFRTSLMDSHLYRNVSPAHQAAVMAFLDSLPALVGAEMSAAMGEMSVEAAPRLGALMSPEHLREAAAFLRSPEMSVAWKSLVGDVIREGSSDGRAFPDITATPEGEAFAATPAGRALVREQVNIDAVLSDAVDMAFAQVQPRLAALMAEGVCAALEDECPQSIRNAIGRT